MNSRRLLTIFVIVFINLLGFGLILPLLPYYAERFDASSTVVGLLIASYSAAQFIGAPLLGRLSDQFGRRPVLLLSIVGSTLGFILLGVADVLWLIFASRVIDGLTGGNISVARAYITDVTDEKNRAKGMGLIGAAFGLGFVIGPAMGGLLSTGERYALPAFVAAGLSFVSLINAYAWLPETLDNRQRAEMKRNGNGSFSWAVLKNVLSRPGVAALLQISFVFGLVFAMFEGVFSLYSQKHLELESNQTGYLLAYVGLLFAFVQGGAIGRLAQRFSEGQLIVGSSAILVPSMLGWAYAPTMLSLVVVLTPLSLAVGVLSTTIHSVLTKQVKNQEVGGVLGVASSIGSVTRILGPITGAILLDVLGTWAPGLFGALLVSWLLFYARHYIVRDARRTSAMTGIEGKQSRV
ncbi:MAG: major facilitator superfamily domain-containing protein 9 [Chloroflexi bacterium]|nr:major facilitator superfamily domain-containing protein 9 [Chloroflexota bacterium]